MRDDIKVETELSWVISTGHIKNEDNMALTALIDHSKSSDRDGIPLDEMNALFVKGYGCGWVIQIPIWDNENLGKAIKNLEKSGTYSAFFIGLIYVCILSG